MSIKSRQQILFFFLFVLIQGKYLYIKQKQTSLYIIINKTSRTEYHFRAIPNTWGLKRNGIPCATNICCVVPPVKFARSIDCGIFLINEIPNKNLYTGEQRY
jgi:hypothetical protein